MLDRREFGLLANYLGDKSLFMLEILEKRCYAPCTV